MKRLLLICLLMVTSCSTPNLKDKSHYSDQRAEIQQMCQAAMKLNQQNFKSKAARNLAINQKLEQIAKSRETTNMVKSIPLQSKDRRWELFQMGADKLGLESYECEALENFYSSDY